MVDVPEEYPGVEQKLLESIDMMKSLIMSQVLNSDCC